jgi:hypothetical protein
VHAVLELQSSPVKTLKLDPVGFGVTAMVQAVPFQDSTRIVELPVVGLL